MNFKNILTINAVILGAIALFVVFAPVNFSVDGHITIAETVANWSDGGSDDDGDCCDSGGSDSSGGWSDGGSDDDGDCCDYSQSNYYSQSDYYSQSSYSTGVKTCEDYGFDFTVAKWEVGANSLSLDGSIRSGYQVGASIDTGSDNITWTANPAVAGVLAKAATNYGVVDGGTGGTLTKASVGAGKHAISHFSLCGNDPVEPPEPPEEPKECKLRIEKAVNKQNALVDDELTYTISFKNVGTADCTGGGVKVVDHLEDNIVFVRESLSSEVTSGYGGSGANNAASRSLYWNAHTLVPGETGSITWIGKVTEPAQCGDFTIYNEVKITAKELDNFTTWVTSHKVSTGINNDCYTPGPKCDFFTADRTTVPYGGGDVAFEWGTSNASSVSIDGIGSVDKDGSTTVNVTEETTYTLTVIGANYSKDRCAIDITIEEPNKPITCEDHVSFSASPTKLGIGGGDVTLTWSTVNSDSVTLNGTVVALNGNTVENVTADKTFVLEVTGDSSTAGNTVSCPVKVEVEIPGPDPITCENNVTFTANPTSLPFGGGEVTLEWNTTDLASLELDGSPVLRDDSKTFTVTNDRVFNLVAVGNQNTAGNQVSCPVQVTVEDETEDPLTCDDVTFRTSDASVREGESVKLSWSWSDSRVDSARINNGIGAVTNNDSETVRIDGDITYFITIENADSDVACPVSIDASTGGGGGGGSSSPRCDLDISDERIKLGEEITLEWDTTRATQVTITDDEGNIIVTTEDLLGSDKRDLYDGKIDLKPTRDTEYTLVAERGSRDRTCRVEVEVEDSVTVIEVRDQEPRVAGIALTQVPYTGFEAGPMLTAIFYGLLTLWALFVAYVVVLKRDGLGGVSYAGAHEHNAYTDVSPDNGGSEMNAAEAYVASTASVATPVATPEVPHNLPTVPEASAPVIGYAAQVPAVEDAVETVAEEIEDEFTAIENHAHSKHVLLSTDAMRFLANAHGTGETAIEALDALIEKAKTSFPSEDGWVVLNLARVESLTGETLAPAVTEDITEVAAPESAGSLAEAVVSGNIVAAYQMIGNRPMVALAAAAADLDAAYRARLGEDVAISDVLEAETAKLTVEQMQSAISALTSAIDGTYTNEAEAVKMAIMKAINAVG